MLRRIQSIRLGRRTTLLVIAIAVVIWTVVVMARLQDFVPKELTTPRSPPAGDSAARP